MLSTAAAALRCGLTGMIHHLKTMCCCSYVYKMGKCHVWCQMHLNPAASASQHVGLQRSCDCRDQWLECARAAFASMDSTETGHITSSQLVSMLSTKLPAEEVEHAVEDALMEAGCGGEPVMLLRFMWVYVRFIRCTPLYVSKQPQRSAHVYSTL